MRQALIEAKCSEGCESGKEREIGAERIEQK